MYIDDFIWFPDIIDKIEAKHQTTQDEAEEVFFDKPKFRFVEFGHILNEDVYSSSGQTESGRYIIVFFILKSNNRALILSARDMDENERRCDERK
jgi:hypothetical protein